MQYCGEGGGGGGGYHDACGGYLEYCGGYHDQCGGILCTVRDIMTNVEVS